MPRVRLFAIALLFLLLVLGGTLPGQSSSRILFNRYFAKEDSDRLGLSKLSPAEQEALGEHVHALVERSRVAGKVLPPATPEAPLKASGVIQHGAIASALSIKENIDRGKFIQLSDGSLWELQRLERMNASLWMKFQAVTVVNSDDGSFGFNFAIVNTDTGEMAHAKPLVEAGSRSISVSVPTYLGADTKHWIQDVVSGGGYIKLDDGSLWKIDSLDTISTSLWLPMEDIRVIDGGGSPNYRLVNTDHSETVGATLLAVD